MPSHTFSQQHSNTQATSTFFGLALSSLTKHDFRYWLRLEVNRLLKAEKSLKMPYIMNVSIDGACSDNGAPNAIAASAAVIHWRGRRPGIVTDVLGTPPIATS